MTNSENRVLGRKGARVVTEIEAAAVNAGIQTDTICTSAALLGPMVIYLPAIALLYNLFRVARAIRATCQISLIVVTVDT